MRRSLIALTFALSGCGNLVQLPGIVRVSDPNELLDYRNLLKNGPVNGQSFDDRYVLTESDEVEFTSASITPTAYQLDTPHDEYCSDCANKLCLEGGTILTGASNAPRLTGRSFGFIRGVHVFNADEKERIACLWDYRTVPWNQLRERLEKNLGLDVALYVGSKQWAFPGDTVRILIENQLNPYAGQLNPVYVQTQVTQVIDAQGRGYVPAMNSPAPISGQPPQYSIVARSVDEADLKVSFWSVGKVVTDQLTLAEIENCLQWAVAHPAVDTKDFPIKCSANGIESRKFRSVNDVNANIRYHIQVEQSNTFVLLNGSRIVRPFQPGQTVGNALREVYRNNVRREIGIGEEFYVAVDPRSELRASHEKPFFSTLSATPESVLDQILLMPGDVIFLSNWRPIDSQ